MGVRILSNIIKLLDEAQWITAQLKTVNESDIRNFNSQMGKQYQGYCNSITPHYYNRVALMRNYSPSSGVYGGIFTPYGIGGAGDNNRTILTALGLINDVNFNASSTGSGRVYQQALNDYVFYYQLIPVSSYDWGASDIIDNPALYDNVYTVSVGCPPNSGKSVIPTIGTARTCIKGQQGFKPTPTHNYDNWYVVKTWEFYSRAIGSTKNRAEVGTGGASNGVFPAVVFDINTPHWFNIANYKCKPKRWNGTSQALILANLANGASCWRSLRVLCDWWGVELDNIEGNFVEFGSNSIRHNSTLGENIKILTPQANTEIEKWFDFDNGTMYAHPNITLGERAILAFKSEDDFLKLLADWGINSRITNNLTDAKEASGGSFPNSTGGGYVPGGGDDSGYNNDPTIPAIPSFSDNTSDKITPSTPNISAINAASTYALSLVDVKSLLNWLMTDNFITNISNLFSDKLSAIDDLKIYPFDLVQHDIGHTQQSPTLTIANVSGDISCYKVLPAYNCILDGGNYHYVAYWGNANDYTSATYYLYVPYAGIVELSPSHVVNCDLRLIYAIDIMTGSATAIIYSNDVLVKTIPCQIAQTVPITFTNTNQRQIKNALTALNTVNSISNAASGAAMNAAAGNVGGAVASGSSGLLGIGNAIASTVLTNPLTIGSIGSFSGNTALVMPQTAFLIISRIQLSIPSSRDKLAGIPSNIATTINSFVGSGFVQINVGHINTAATTDEQRQMIELLKNGIFI